VRLELNLAEKGFQKIPKFEKKVESISLYVFTDQFFKHLPPVGPNILVFFKSDSFLSLSL